MLIIYRKIDGRVMACFSDESQTLEKLYPNQDSFKNKMDSVIMNSHDVQLDMRNYKVIDGKLIREVETENAWQ